MTGARGRTSQALPRRAGRARSRLPVVRETSAGGVVVRRIRGRWHVALLKIRHARGEVWVLPKGHVEHHRGETPERAAIREVKEELGIASVRVIRKLGAVRWNFRGVRESERAHGTGSWQGGERPRISPRGSPVLIAKTVHHYLMEGLTDALRPQASEGFLDGRWVSLEKALRDLAYPTDRSVVARAKTLLQELRSLKKVVSVPRSVSKKREGSSAPASP